MPRTEPNAPVPRGRDDLIPLQQGLAAFGAGNSYSWHQASARRDGTTTLGEITVPVLKVSGRWMVSAGDVDRAVAARAARRAQIAQHTADYDAGVLHTGGPVQVRWGSYTVSGTFHHVTIWRPMAPDDTSWVCNTCMQSAVSQHELPECHRCRDWSPCGADCTLSGISCPRCGTSRSFTQS